MGDYHNPVASRGNRNDKQAPMAKAMVVSDDEDVTNVTLNQMGRQRNDKGKNHAAFSSGRGSSCYFLLARGRLT